MANIETKVDPGICGLKSIIKAVSEDGMTAQVTVESECSDIVNMGKELGDIDAMGEIFKPFGQSSVFEAAQKHCRHATCPVPTAVLKSVEATCSLALPKDVIITMEKVE